MSEKTFYFLSNNGSYTLVLKEESGKIIYNHKGIPVRHTKSHFCEFKLQKNGFGSFNTNSFLLAELIRGSSAFGKTIIEVKNKKDMLKKVEAVTIVKVPKSALMACNRNELIKMAKDYKIELKEDDTKKIIVDAILEKQEEGFVPKGNEEGASTQGGTMNRIIQKVN